MKGKGVFVRFFVALVVVFGLVMAGCDSGGDSGGGGGTSGTGTGSDPVGSNPSGGTDPLGTGDTIEGVDFLRLGGKIDGKNAEVIISSKSSKADPLTTGNYYVIRFFDGDVISRGHIEWNDPAVRFIPDDGSTPFYGYYSGGTLKINEIPYGNKEEGWNLSGSNSGGTDTGDTNPGGSDPVGFNSGVAVYSDGTYREGSNTYSGYWKNGVRQSPGYGLPLVYNGSLYVMGLRGYYKDGVFYEFGEPLSAITSGGGTVYFISAAHTCYWKDGVRQSFDLSGISGYCFANSVFESGGSIYITGGFTESLGGKGYPYYWKDGVRHDFPTTEIYGSTEMNNIRLYFE